MKERQFKVNNYISLKLSFEYHRINLYVAEEYCRNIYLDPPFKKEDEVNGFKSHKDDIEVEFLAQCSILQEWVENNYDTRFLNHKVAFPLLKKLSDVGDPKAIKVFKEEIIKRLEDGENDVILYLLNKGYLDNLNENDFISTGHDFVKYGGQVIPIFNNVLKLRNKSIKDLSKVKFLFERDNLQALDLERNDLKKLPKAISNLKSLKILYLGNNKVKTLPSSMKFLDSLETLSLDDNNLKHYPEVISNIFSLKNLNLSRNNLKRLPKSMGNLQSLKILNVGENELIALPESIGRLTSLERLSLVKNKLKKLPESIGNLNSLVSIDLYTNNLLSIPASIGNLVSLKTLDLERNEISALPESLGSLKSVRWLNLRANNLKTLPESIGELTSLRRLNLWKNNISIFPKSIKKLEKQGITDHIYIKKLELMQIKFKEWLRRNSNIKNDRDYHNIIEKKITEIANKNGYRFFMRFDELGPEMIILAYQNRKNDNFISAYANEEGFDDEEYEDFGL